MSDEIETGSSAEEQFFNVKTQHGKSIEDSSSDSSGLEIEVIDDTPEESVNRLDKRLLTNTVMTLLRKSCKATVRKFKSV